jgi:hypothetical protein
MQLCTPITGRGSVVGMATRYGLDGRGSNPVKGVIFITPSDMPRDLSSLLHSEYQVIPGSKAAGPWR